MYSRIYILFTLIHKIHDNIKELLRSNALKDEELKTERKQNEGKISATNEGFEKQITNLQAKYDEGKGREKKLETENKELKDENKKINNELKEHKKGVKKIKEMEDEIARLEKELLRSDNLKDKELRNLKTEKKENEDKFSSTIKRLEEQRRNLQAKHDEDYRDVYEACRIECAFDSKNIRELKNKIEILEKGVKKIKEMEDEIARLKDDKERLEKGNLLDICYILDKMNMFDQSLKEHDVKGIIKYRGV